MENRKSANDQVLRGIISKITYANHENGFTVLQVKTDQNPLPITVTGLGLPSETGIEVLLRGSYQTHQKYGKQFKAEHCEEVQPSNEDSMVKFLASGIFTGIGEKTARDIFDHFGLNTLKIISTQSYRLTEVPGIGKAKAEKIAESMEKHSAVFELRRFLSELDLSNFQTGLIIKCYGNQAVEIIKKDPYKLAYDIRGIAFKKADAIAGKVGIEANSTLRIRAGVFYTINSTQEDGHCFIMREQLYQKATELLQVNIDEDFQDTLQNLEEQELIYTEGERIYSFSLFQAETQVAEWLAARTGVKPVQKIDQTLAEKAIARFADSSGLSLSSLQKQAIHDAILNNLLVITGGPGCGKTTVLQIIVDTYRLAKKNIRLCAPTGKAAQKMGEVCDMPASTIHRLLGYDPVKENFVYNSENQLCYETETTFEPLDLLIVDETSMLDILLAKDLLTAISPQTTVILVGDKDQLPSVGPGKVFADILDSNQITRIIFDQIFRQAENSRIIQAAHQVNKGILPNIPVPDGKTRSDIYFIKRQSSEQVHRLVENLYLTQIPEKFKIPSSDITLLSPTNLGPLGIQEFNTNIQSAVNPAHPTKAEIKIGERILREGDQIVQRVNNYQIDPQGVYNGDLGEIIQINAQSREMTVRLWDNREVIYSGQDIPQVSLAYALTIHRFQGSEAPCVILIIHESQFMMLDRQLIYTAMTRATKLLLIVGTQRALSIATQREKSRKRNTRLTERINLATETNA